MNIFYAMYPKVLEKFWNFREVEKRVSTELSPELIANIRAKYDEARGEHRLYEARDGVAWIPIVGTLTPRPTLSAWLFGSETSYTDIRDAVTAAEEDPEVREIAYMVDTPGGYWDGLDLTAEYMAEAGKPSVAYVSGLAASAGYYLASQADHVIAMSRGIQIGSIGVAIEIFDRSGADKKAGVRRIVITNSASMDKRPDAATEEGYAVHQDELNDVYGIFEERVIEGRMSAGKTNFAAANIRALKGRVVTARTALELELIDEVKGIKSPAPVGSQKSTKREGDMNLQQYFEKHPEAQEEVDAIVADKIRANVAEIRAEAQKGGRLHALALVELSGVKPSASLKQAITDGMSEGDFAIGALKTAQAQVPSDNTDALGGGVSPAKMPAETAPSTSDGRQQVETQANAHVAVMKKAEEVNRG